VGTSSTGGAYVRETDFVSALIDKGKMEVHRNKIAKHRTKELKERTRPFLQHWLEAIKHRLIVFSNNKNWSRIAAFPLDVESYSDRRIRSMYKIDHVRQSRYQQETFDPASQDR